MEVTVRITKNYGQEAIYPTNGNGLTFAQMTGKKTLSRNDIENIKFLGFIVRVESPEL